MIYLKQRNGTEKEQRRATQRHAKSKKYKIAVDITA